MKKPLFDQNEFHDACGTGFITRISGEPSREIVTLAIEALKRLTHRGAKSADSKTGDGSGLLTDIPQEFFRKILWTEFDFELGNDESLAIAVVFTSTGKFRRLEKTVIRQINRLNMKYVGYRKVPVNIQALGAMAQATCPEIIQFIISIPNECIRNPEAQLYLLRRSIENKISVWDSETYFCSFSSKTIVYKGLLTAQQIDHFYLDLIDPDYCAKVALFHERFSTNTNPSWDMAQPFRMLAHNGEINTIKGNRLWMQSREDELESPFWGDDLKKIKPITAGLGSDSFSLDNTLEFLTHSGRSLFQSLMMLIPEPYNEDRKMSQALKDFYVYHENYIEPWDGPAALVYTDGDFVGAKLDRNGLRPLRYSITKDGLVIMASEAGVVDIDEDNLVVHHHMMSGEIFAVALDGSGIISNQQIKADVAGSGPYSQLIGNSFMTLQRGDNQLEFGDFALPESGFDTRLRLALGWSSEDLSRFLIPMAKSGREPLGSMGDDTPLAILSRKHRRLYDYFKQSFAQVTNPPIDPIRERFVTSLSLYLGSEENLLAEEPHFNGAIKLDSPVLSPREVRILMESHDWFPHTKILCHLPVDCDFATRLEELKQECESAIERGCKLIFLSDENLAENLLPIPMALMVSSIHHHLSMRKIRSKVSLICLTGDTVEDHHIACLIGMGASAVYPYMAYELIREHFDREDWPHKMGNYRYALEKGLLKIMSKMGISTFTSYHGSMLFHGLGLSQELIDNYLPSIQCVTGGIGLSQIRQNLIDRNTYAFQMVNPGLENRGFFQYRKEGELHGFAPAVFKRIRSTADSGEGQTEAEAGIIHLRDLVEFKSCSPIPINQVEPVENIMSRFGCGAISFGAISDESHRVLAKGMMLIGGRANTGEGGEPADRYAHSNPDQSANSYTKQVASGRFGVTVDYLAAAQEIQIKMAQGAKPGEGGQLPGHKVSVQIASARSSTPGVPLISPPPHHDIYSIEDIAQLIYDLKQVNPRARVSVKLVAQPGVGTVASGVVKAGADIILISGADGGTGAAPLGSMKHVGFPWELGLAETHQALVANDLRDRVVLRVDGGLKNARDIIIAAILGAEEYDFGTAILVSIGCVMARQCHLNTCPAGIATQDEKLKQRFKGRPEQVRKYLSALAEDIRSQLGELGAFSLNEIIGADLLMIKPELEEYTAGKGLDILNLVNPGDRTGFPLTSNLKLKPTELRPKPHLDEEIIGEVRSALMTHGQAVVTRKVSNTDRAIGTRLAGEVAFLFGRGNFNGSIQCHLEGSAGQSLGAFLTDGIELHLRGIANDFVGKGMGGGLITIRLPHAIRQQDGAHTMLGNVALYGATGGTLLVAGKAGERFAVRNSGASAVVEGMGNHGCEYMTRGTVVVLGEHGDNFGAGMTGGVAYLLDKNCVDQGTLNTDFVRMVELTKADYSLVRNLVRQHHFHTRSKVAESLLDNWETEKNCLIKILPVALDIIDFTDIYNQQVDARMGVLLNE